MRRQAQCVAQEPLRFFDITNSQSDFVFGHVESDVGVRYEESVLDRFGACTEKIWHNCARVIPNSSKTDFWQHQRVYGRVITIGWEGGRKRR